MIMLVLRLIRWEWFKLRKRWMPWILLAIAIAMTQLLLWGDYSQHQDVGRYVGSVHSIHLPNGERVRITCIDMVEGNVDAKLALIPEEFRQGALEAVEERRASELSCEEDLEQTAEQYAKRRGFYREGFVLPSSLSNSLSGATSIGILLIMILGASAMGVEYGWGTLRTGLITGISRRQFLGVKVMSLLLLGAAGLTIVALSVLVGSLISASLVSGDGAGIADSGQWSTAVVMFGKAVYALVPYLVLALFLSVLTSSSSMGIAFSLAYVVVEIILLQFLSDLFEWFGTLTDFMLGPNIAGWMTQAGVRSNSWIADAGVFTQTGGLVRISELPSQLHAFLVLTAYIVVLGGAALWLIRRRDIAGARGE